MRDRGDLVDDTLVTTVMSNLGLKIAMTEAGIATIHTAVGDRYVLEAMRAGGYSLGGEQSGHIIMAAHATTGDGVLTALQLAARVAATGEPIAEARRRGPAAAADAGQRARRRQGPGRHRRPAARGGAGSPRPAWVTPAGCCCARRAPRTSCASWSRRARRPRPTGSRTSWPTSCASGSPCERTGGVAVGRPPSARRAEWDQALRDTALWIIEAGTRSHGGRRADRPGGSPGAAGGRDAVRRAAVRRRARRAARRHAPHDAGRARRRPGRARSSGLPLALAVLEDPGTTSEEHAQVREREPLPYRVLVNPSYERGR